MTDEQQSILCRRCGTDCSIAHFLCCGKWFCRECIDQHTEVCDAKKLYIDNEKFCSMRVSARVDTIEIARWLAAQNSDMQAAFIIEMFEAMQRSFPDGLPMQLRYIGEAIDRRTADHLKDIADIRMEKP